MRLLEEGVDPNCEWRSMLPLRMAVMTADVDMVALLTCAGADPMLEPVATLYKKNEETGERTEEKKTVGKCARLLAQEIADEISNPLHREGKLMVQVLDDKEQRHRRMLALQTRLEAEVSERMRDASRSFLVSGLIAAASLYFLYYYGLPRVRADAGHDPREL